MIFNSAPAKHSTSPMPGLSKAKLDAKQLLLFLRFRLWLGSVIYTHRGETHFPKAFRIPRQKLVKSRCHCSELEAIRFAEQYTTIPVPRVIEVYDDGDSQHLVMEYVAGEPLDVAWPVMTTQQKKGIVEQLTGYVGQLRSLVLSRSGAVGSTALGSGYNHRLGGNRFGPFKTITDFHTFIRRETPLDSWDESVSRVYGRPDFYTTKYTHATSVLITSSSATGKSRPSLTRNSRAGSLSTGNTPRCITAGVPLSEGVI